MKKHPLFEKKRIFAPGPTPVPPEVLSKISIETLHHRTKQFEKTFENCRTKLKYLFCTKEPVYIITSSGTGAMEAAITNVFSKSDKVLVINGGKFGERWGEIASSFGLTVLWHNVKLGYSANPEDIKKILKDNPEVKGVLIQASETSTGILHPIKEIAEVIHKSSDALIVVDAISALGASLLPMDEWGLDVVVGGSQKALMLPPGLSFLAFSQRASTFRKTSDLPKYYFDLRLEDKAFLKKQSAFTPAVNLICALETVLERLENVGLNVVLDYHTTISQATRAGIKALGLELFSKGIPSPALTAICVPQCIGDGKKIVSHLKDNYSVTIAGGQGELTGKIFRIAHIGHYDTLDVITSLGAIELTLTELGYKVEIGSSIREASRYLIKGENQ